MSPLFEHAKTEMALLRKGEPDEMQYKIEKQILEIIEVFSQEGHSGFSASYTIEMLYKLLKLEPLTPLTGHDSEWVDQSKAAGETLFQNKRCGHVFKNNEGAWDIHGIIWRDTNGYCYTNYESRIPVIFPYIPKREYRDRISS